MRGLGVLQTTWVGFAAFARAYFGEEKNPSQEATESVACFRALFAAIRAGEVAAKPAGTR